MALICLLLCGGVNAWATTYTWIGPNKNADYQGTLSTTNYYPIGGNPNNPVSIKGTDGINYDKPRLGITIPTDGIAYLKNTSNNPVLIKITVEKVGEHAYTRVLDISESTTNFDLRVENIAEATSNQGTGTAIRFEMQPGKEYLIQNPTQYKQQFYFKKIEVWDNWLTLDETRSDNGTAISNKNGQNLPIKLVRTLKANQWNTFCLPVTINAVNNSFATQLKCSAVYEMTGYNASDHTITFSPIQASNGTNIYRANTPCLIKPTEDLVNPILEGSGNITNGQPTKTVSGLSFVGVYDATNIFTTGDESATKFYMNNSGYLVYPTSNAVGTIKGLRAYFECAGVSSLAKGMTFAFEDTQTGIKTVEFDVLDNGRVYSIDGRYVGNSTDNLSRGIYIQNGRKFVVK